jgi:DNA-binding response OmpR family regulator
MVVRVLAYEPDLLFSSRIESTGKKFGIQVTVATDMKEVLQILDQNLPDILLVNLDTTRERNESLNELEAKGKCRMIGYYSHMEEDSAREATRAGFEVVPRRSFAVKLHDILATVTSG